MKRAGNLFERIAERDNLRLAFSKAIRGKRDRLDARRFAATVDENLERMAVELRAGSHSVGRYHQFVIHDPKERIITAPCFAERVLHHAIMNVCEPLFERWLIHDTYACRVGRGRIAAVARAQRFARRHSFFLKLDVRKYFDSVSHEILLSRLKRIFKDRRLLALFGRIVRSFRGSLGRGLPIGSLTSQHFANFYLGWLDRYVKETLRVKGYVRYMDDMVLWAESARPLKAALNACRGFLADQLELQIKAYPYINRTLHGVDFLGCRVRPDHVVLNRRSRNRFRRRLLRLESRFLDGEIEETELQDRGTALIAFTRAAEAKSWHFRRAVLEQLPVSGRRPRTG